MNAPIEWLTAAQWDRATSLSLPAARTTEATEATEAYGLPSLRLTPSQAGAWIGRRAQGSSVNCDDASLCIHSGGTHTECVAHISDLPLQISEVAPLQLLPALLVHVAPQERADGSRVILRTDLERAWCEALEHTQTPTTLVAAVIRSRSPLEPPHRRWSGSSPPYFSEEALGFLVDVGVLHLVTDLPSLDPESDGGALRAHRRFFGLEPMLEDRHRRTTVTELAWIPEELQSGLGLLRLDIVEWSSDAAPSRPVFYPVPF